MGIGIVPAPEARSRLLAVANEIRGSTDADFVVGPSAPPHVSLSHAHCEDGQEHEWWQRCRSALADVPSVEVLELAISQIPMGDFHSPRGGVYAGLNLVRDADLAEAHHRVIAEAQAVGARPRGSFGTRYHPHVTLAVLRAVPQISAALTIFNCGGYTGT
jgi:2'-5' RNA ligase